MLTLDPDPSFAWGKVGSWRATEFSELQNFNAVILGITRLCVPLSAFFLKQKKLEDERRGRQPDADAWGREEHIYLLRSGPALQQKIFQAGGLHESGQSQIRRVRGRRDGSPQRLPFQPLQREAVERGRRRPFRGRALAQEAREMGYHLPRDWRSLHAPGKIRSKQKTSKLLVRLVLLTRQIIKYIQILYTMG